MTTAVAVPKVEAGNKDKVNIALKADGTVWTWTGTGIENYGLGTNPTWVNVGGSAVAVATANGFFAAALSDGRVAVVNNNNLASPNIRSFTSVNGSPSHITSLTATNDVIYGLDGNTGEVYILASTYSDRVRAGMVASHTGGKVKHLTDDLGNPTGVDTTTFYQSSYVTNIVEIKADGEGLLLLHASGQVFAMGRNTSGYLGTGRNRSELYGIDESAPYPVAGGDMGTTYLTNALTLAAGAQHSLAMVRHADGSHGLMAWGRNTEGQMGDNSNLARRYPVHVMNEDNSAWLTGVVAVYAGGNSSAALVAHTPSKQIEDDRASHLF